MMYPNHDGLYASWAEHIFWRFADTRAAKPECQKPLQQAAAVRRLLQVTTKPRVSQKQHAIDNAVEIRELRKQGVTIGAIAQRMNVHSKCIRDVLRRKDGAYDV